MKIFYTIFCLLFTTITFSQTFYSDFNDLTLQGWTNEDDSTTLLTVEEEGANTFFLQKISDGSDSAVGEMAIINIDQWSGNYFYDPNGNGEVLRIVDDIYMKNSNDFDLHLRCGFTGANGYRVVTTEPIIIPALSDWNYYGFQYYLNFPVIDNLTILNDIDGIPYEEVFNNVHDLFENVVELKLIHNEVISYDGQIMVGSLQIDYISSIELLSNEDNKLSEAQLFPNPVEDIVTLKLPFEDIGSITFYTILGKKVLTHNFNSSISQIDLSELVSGIYLASIKTENQTVIKKIIKK